MGIRQIHISSGEWSKTPETVRELVKALISIADTPSRFVDQQLDCMLKVQKEMGRERIPKQVAIVTGKLFGRLYKHAVCLKELGWDVLLISSDSGINDSNRVFSKIMVCKDLDKILETCLSVSPQIYHIFTNWEFELPAYLIASGIRPVVYDNYDALNGCIVGRRIDDYPSEKMLALERYSVENADAVTSRDGRMLVSKRKAGLRPKRVAMCLDGSLTQIQADSIRMAKRTDGIHAVYIGNMYEPTSSQPRNFHFQLSRTLANSGIHYHMYPSNMDLYNSYRPLMERFAFENCPNGFVHLHPPVPVNHIVREISQYHFGIDVLTKSVDRVPGDHEFYSMETTEYGIDNKIFDYISAGLYTFVSNARWCRRILERYGLGIRVRSFEEIIHGINAYNYNAFPRIPEVLTTHFWSQRLLDLYDKISVGSFTSDYALSF